MQTPVLPPVPTHSATLATMTDREIRICLHMAGCATSLPDTLPPMRPEVAAWAMDRRAHG